MAATISLRQPRGRSGQWGSFPSGAERKVVDSGGHVRIADGNGVELDQGTRCGGTQSRRPDHQGTMELSKPVRSDLARRPCEGPTVGKKTSSDPRFSG